MTDETEKTPLKTLQKIMSGCLVHKPFHHSDCYMCIDVACRNMEGHREEVLRAFQDITDAIREPFEEIVKTMTSFSEELGRLFDRIQEVSERVYGLETRAVEFDTNYVELKCCIKWHSNEEHDAHHWTEDSLRTRYCPGYLDAKVSND